MYYELFDLPPEVAFTNEDINYLWSIRPQNPHIVKIYGKTLETPRLQAAFGRDYAFSGTIVRAQPIPPLLLPLMDFLNEKYNCNLNMALINWYRDGNDYISPHSDNETQINPNIPIITVSIGATRDFVLTPRDKNLERVVLKHGSNQVITMFPGCQQVYKHGVPKRKGIRDYRISLTFREFI